MMIPKYFSLCILKSFGLFSKSEGNHFQRKKKMNSLFLLADGAVHCLLSSFN